MVCDLGKTRFGDSSKRVQFLGLDYSIYELSQLSCRIQCCQREPLFLVHQRGINGDSQSLAHTIKIDRLRSCFYESPSQDVKECMHCHRKMLGLPLWTTAYKFIEVVGPQNVKGTWPRTISCGSP